MNLATINIFNKIKSFLFRKIQNKNRNQDIINQTMQSNSRKKMFNDIDVEEINDLTDNIACSRYRNVDYTYISELATKILQIPSNLILLYKNYNYEYSVSKEESIKIALDFLKELDEEFYEKASRIIEGRDENVSIDMFNILDGSRNDYSSEKNNEAKVLHDGIKKKIIVPLKGNIEDIYSIVHEISHTFDIGKELNLSRIMLADVTSECFERMLDCYIENNEKINETLKKDVLQVKRNSLAKTYFLSLEYIIKYEFFNCKNNSGELKKTDIKSIMSRFRISPNMVIEYLNDNSQDINYSARYILGGIASEEFLQIYLKDSKEAVNKIKIYMEQIKEDTGIEALKQIDIKMDETILKNEVKRVYKYPEEFNAEKSNENTQSIEFEE